MSGNPWPAFGGYPAGGTGEVATRPLARNFPARPSLSGDAPTGGQEREGAAVTGVTSVDTLRETGTLQRLRDAARRRNLADHEVRTEMTRAFAEGHVPAEVDAAMAVRWPGVPR